MSIHCWNLREASKIHLLAHISEPACYAYCGRPWPAAYINFMQNTHQIHVLTKPLSRYILFAAEQRVGYQISLVDLQREVDCP